ncbi:hypothetical protein [Kocuria kalidii]|uniref:hypothetical protein n=1 Tax=Kocuria kalidii TaxID=3376283 RepID=UPI00379463A7
MEDPTDDRTGSRVLRTVYTLLLGTLLALFVGLGMATVHPGPEEPAPPPAVAGAQESREPAPEVQQQRAAYERDREAWAAESAPHHRDVGVVALVAAVLLLAAGPALERRRPVLGRALLLGGLLTLLHGVVRGLLSQDTLAAFGLVTVALVVLLHLGYRRFVDRPTDPSGPTDSTDPGGPWGSPPVVVSSNGKHPSRR